MVSFKDVFIGYYNISNSSLICYSILALHDINILHNDYYILYSMRVGVGHGVSVGQRYYIIYINIKIYNKSLACCLKRGLNVLIR